MGEKSESCGRCEKKINFQGNYCKAEIYKNGKLVKTGYLHSTCNEEMNQINRTNQSLINRATEIGDRVLQGIGGGETVVEIK
jgi:hypothetical protein